MENLKANTQNENVQIAIAIMEKANIFDYSFSGYSDTNGVSVYFKNANGVKIRVSNHTVTKYNRVMDELHLSFNQKTFGIGGKIGFKDNSQINKLSASKFGY